METITRVTQDPDLEGFWMFTGYDDSARDDLRFLNDFAAWLNEVDSIYASVENTGGNCMVIYGVSRVGCVAMNSEGVTVFNHEQDASVSGWERFVDWSFEDCDWEEDIRQHVEFDFGGYEYIMDDSPICVREGFRQINIVEMWIDLASRLTTNPSSFWGCVTWDSRFIQLWDEDGIPHTLRGRALAEFWGKWNNGFPFYITETLDGEAPGQDDEWVQIETPAWVNLRGRQMNITFPIV